MNFLHVRVISCRVPPFFFFMFFFSLQIGNYRHIVLIAMNQALLLQQRREVEVLVVIWHLGDKQKEKKK